jgi:hypothetical protein
MATPLREIGPVGAVGAPRVRGFAVLDMRARLFLKACERCQRSFLFHYRYEAGARGRFDRVDPVDGLMDRISW